MTLSTPVAFFIFNRPHLTQTVFEAIRQAQPRQLLVVADGPRADRPDEVDRCAKTRQVIDQVDWPCEVHTNFADRNLGCKQRLASGLTWVFDTVETAIILEDDCLPHPTFFPFCETLLERYREDTRIMVISGVNFQQGRRRTDDSYYFSYYNHCWGWASWRRAWHYYDVNMALWPQIKQGNWLRDLWGSDRCAAYWTAIFDRVASGQIDTWDYQWAFACWLQNGLTILPNVNLVSNIGFGSDATHTIAVSQLSQLPTVAMSFPLKHPEFMIRDAQADAYTHLQHQIPPFIVLKSNVKKALKRLTRMAFPY